MKEESRSYGSLERQSYEKLKTDEDSNWTIDNLAALYQSGSNHEVQQTLSPETDYWECSTTLACSALNAFALSFNVVSFVPVTRTFGYDFGFNVIQVCGCYVFSIVSKRFTGLDRSRRP